MDMKRILQALDCAATKPVAGAKDMKRFLEIVSSSPVISESETLTEGANPHKVTLPVQMVMQHYQQTPVKTESNKHIKTSIKKFFREVQTEVAEAEFKEKEHKRQLLQQYSQQIAERVLMKESISENTKTYGTFTQADWDNAIEVHIPYLSSGWVGVGFRGHDVLVFADDVQVNDRGNAWISFIFNITTNKQEYFESRGEGFEYGSVDDDDVSYTIEDLVAEVKDYYGETAEEVKRELGAGLNSEPEHPVAEGKAIKPKKKSDPCWSGYHQVGMKKKGDKMVPNCTKKNALKETEVSETRIIHANDKVNVYYNPHRSNTRQIVARNVPNHKVDAIVNTLALKYKVDPKSFDWQLSKVTDAFDPNVSPNPGFKPGPGGPGLMNENDAAGIMPTPPKKDYAKERKALEGRLDLLSTFKNQVSEVVNQQRHVYNELESELRILEHTEKEHTIDSFTNGDITDKIRDAIMATQEAYSKAYEIFEETAYQIKWVKNHLDDLQSEEDEEKYDYDDGSLSLGESEMDNKITKRNPVAHAAQKVAKGSGAHKNKKREQEVPRKEKHKKLPMSEELNMIMSDPAWSAYKGK